VSFSGGSEVRFALPFLLTAVLAMGTQAVDCPEPDMNSPQMAEIQTKMMALMGPGPEHEILAKMAGSWEGQLTMFMPGMSPISTAVSQSSELILGGRFCRGTQTGNMMGMPVESIVMLGYDRRHEVYTLVGFDTMGTYYITANGKYDAASKTIKLSGKDDEPIGGITQVYDIEIQFVDDNTVVTSLTFHCPTYGTGGPHKLVETKLTRKKS
jgi:hypothetical protein